MNNLAITADEQRQYQQHFVNANPVNGRLPGAAARANLMQSGLSTQQLGEIWELADIDKDGALDLDEYSVALKLVFSLLAHAIPAVPPVLPPGLIPASKYQHFGSSANLSPPYASPRPADAPAALEWYVSESDRARYQQLFAQHARGGHVRLLDVDEFLGGLGISRPAATQAWALVDVRKYQQLNQEQFTYLLHILSAHLRGAPLPPTLPPAVKDAIYSSLSLAADSTNAARYTKPAADARKPGLYGERSGNVALADSYLSKLKTSSTFKSDTASRYASSSKRADEERKLRAELDGLDADLDRLQADRQAPRAEDDGLEATVRELELLKEHKAREKARIESAAGAAPPASGETLQEIKQAIFQLEGHVSFLLSEKRAIDEFLAQGRQELLDLQMEQIKLK
ncbi:endocytosis defective- protein [Coemansia sp. RSA 2706]|nr:endocytosis defective- protein [Coemansia sp. RSA 2711]KAJ2308024.1 endocytosis defective- protein [Coemansia sp. RSA 2706]KAJ2329085.1 endocytosis defective- protein [Coemansia sp. RSA 2702]